ncbi:MAG: LPS-assembly protein LptD [Oleiphilus sp.]|nr:MAG: LPS-assembly protein LptD [Oleiphilus sp.]
MSIQYGITLKLFMHIQPKNHVLFLLMFLASVSVAEQADDTVPFSRMPASCYTGVEARNTDADDFYLAGEGISEKSQEIEIEADRAELSESGVLKLDGDVWIRQPGFSVRSEQALLDQNNGQAEMLGDIRIDSPALQIRGKNASVNMSENEAYVEQASFINAKTRLRGEAETIRQADQDLVVLEQSAFTTCAPGDNSWSIRASEVILGQERGYGEAYHSRFEVADVPVLYIPYFRFPIDNRRKSGFLYPEFGSSNTGEGMFVSTPYYFNIAPAFDATYTPSFIGGRGLHSELELRHLSRFSNTELGLGYLRRDESFLGEERLTGHVHEDGERWGLSFEQDYDFSYWDQPLYGRIDFAEISDSDYLDDLNQGLRIESKDYLDRRASFNYVQQSWQLEVVAQQYKNLDQTLPANEEAFQRLPEINYQAFFYYDNLELDWRSQYAYFYRDSERLSSEDQAYGSRLRHITKLSLPWSSSWAFVKPSVTLDHTDYALTAYPPQDNHISRTVPVYELDTGLFLDRRVERFGQTYLHSLEPRLYYVYSPYEDQSGIPNFDASLPSFSFQRLYHPNRFSGGDRVADSNRATLGLTSRWTDWASGIDRFVFSVGQVFHYANRKVGVERTSEELQDSASDSSGALLGASSRKDSFIITEATYRPNSTLTLGYAGTWDARENGTRESITKLAYRGEKGGPVLNLMHRYREAELEQTDASFILPVNERFGLLARWRYDLNAERSIGSLAGLEYNSCCWRVQILTQQYLTEDSDIDSGILFRVQLVGLGGTGAELDSLDAQIPGYKSREAYFR